MIQTYESLFSKKAKINYLPFNKADMKSTWANIEKAEKLLGWKPQVSFAQGLENCVKHYQDQADFYKNIKL